MEKKERKAQESLLNQDDFKECGWEPVDYYYEITCSGLKPYNQCRLIYDSTFKTVFISKGRKGLSLIHWKRIFKGIINTPDELKRVMLKFRIKT